MLQIHGKQIGDIMVGAPSHLQKQVGHFVSNDVGKITEYNDTPAAIDLIALKDELTLWQSKGQTSGDSPVHDYEGPSLTWHGTMSGDSEDYMNMDMLMIPAEVMEIAWRVKIMFEEVKLKPRNRLWRTRKRRTFEDLWGSWLHCNPSTPGDCVFDSIAALTLLRGTPPGLQRGEVVCGADVRDSCLHAWQEPWAFDLLKHTAKYEGCSMRKYLMDIGSSKWGGRPDLRVLARHLQVQFRVWSPDHALLFQEGEEFSAVFDLGLACQHYVAVTPDRVSSCLAVMTSKVLSASRGGAVRRSPRRTRSDSRRRTSSSIRLRSRSKARRTGDEELRKKLNDLPRIPGLDHGKEASWITLKTWGVPPYTGADPYCNLCNKWCGTGHRQSEKHAKRLDTYGWGPGEAYGAPRLPRDESPGRAILKPNKKWVKTEIHDECDGVLVVDTKDAKQVKIAVKTVDDTEKLGAEDTAESPHLWARSAMKEQPWLTLIQDHAHPQKHDLYCKLCKRWCDFTHLHSAGHAKRVHNQGPSWQDDDSLDDLMSQPPGVDPSSKPASSSRGGFRSIVNWDYKGSVRCRWKAPGVFQNVGKKVTEGNHYCREAQLPTTLPSSMTVSSGTRPEANWLSLREDPDEVTLEAAQGALPPPPAALTCKQEGSVSSLGSALSPSRGVVGGVSLPTVSPTLTFRGNDSCGDDLVCGPASVPGYLRVRTKSDLLRTPKRKVLGVSRMRTLRLLQIEATLDESVLAQPLWHGVTLYGRLKRLGFVQAYQTAFTSDVLSQVGGKFTVSSGILLTSVSVK